METLTPLAIAAPDSEMAVEWDDSPPAITPAAAAHIAARWAHYVAEAERAGHTLFNGPIARLLAVRQDPPGPAPARRLMLRLGPADYQSFLVTRLRDRPWFETHAPDAMVQALGNSALLTRRDRALLGLRSRRVSAYPGRLHLIGGVLEALGTTRFPATRAGIEAHLLMELQEEVGLVPGEERRDGWPRPLGVAHDDFLGQPELFWQWEPAVDLEALVARIDPAEHASALVLQRDAMTPDLWRQFTPMARLAWRLWSESAFPAPR